MAILGARMLEEEKRQVEATATHEIRRGNESSMLASLVRAGSDGINRALKHVQTFVQGLGEMFIELNTDFTAAYLKPEELKALMEALQKGAISEESFYYNLEQAEFYPLGHSMNDELRFRARDADKRLEQDMKRLESLEPTDLDAE
jgi:hypothetical protein